MPAQEHCRGVLNRRRGWNLLSFLLIETKWAASSGRSVSHRERNDEEADCMYRRIAENDRSGASVAKCRQPRSPSRPAALRKRRPPRLRPSRRKGSRPHRRATVKVSVLIRKPARLNPSSGIRSLGRPRRMMPKGRVRSSVRSRLWSRWRSLRSRLRRGEDRQIAHRERRATLIPPHKVRQNPIKCNVTSDRLGVPRTARLALEREIPERVVRMAATRTLWPPMARAVG
jgi:hypothetical protein